MTRRNSTHLLAAIRRRAARPVVRRLDRLARSAPLTWRLARSAPLTWRLTLPGRWRITLQLDRGLTLRERARRGAITTARLAGAAMLRQAWALLSPL